MRNTLTSGRLRKLIASPTKPPATIALLIIVMPKTVPLAALATPKEKLTTGLGFVDGKGFFLRVLENTIILLPPKMSSYLEHE